MNVTHSKTGRADATHPPAAPVPLPPPAVKAEPEVLPKPSPPDGFEEPRALGSVLDDALSRMERRARGEEHPVPLPWSNVAAALGGGLWGGTLVHPRRRHRHRQDAVGAAGRAARRRVGRARLLRRSRLRRRPDGRAHRLAEGRRKWSDLYVGRSGARSARGGPRRARRGHEGPSLPPRRRIGRALRSAHARDRGMDATEVPRGPPRRPALPARPRLRAAPRRSAREGEPRRDDGARRLRGAPGRARAWCPDPPRLDHLA